MQAIVTKFIPCTDKRQSRVKAFCDAGEITLGWDHELNSQENHITAANALITKLGWGNRQYIAGCLPSRFGGYVFVSAN